MDKACPPPHHHHLSRPIGRHAKWVGKKYTNNANEREVTMAMKHRWQVASSERAIGLRCGRRRRTQQIGVLSQGVAQRASDVRRVGGRQFDQVRIQTDQLFPRNLAHCQRETNQQKKGPDQREVQISNAGNVRTTRQRTSLIPCPTIKQRWQKLALAGRCLLLLQYGRPFSEIGSMAVGTKVGSSPKNFES